MHAVRVIVVGLVGLVASSARAGGLSEHGLGFGYHTVVFTTESSDTYTLHGPSLVYDYFHGRRWGFALRAAAWAPVFGSMSGPSGDYSGSLLGHGSFDVT